jgi:hypothetical protein
MASLFAAPAVRVTSADPRVGYGGACRAAVLPALERVNADRC